MRRPLPSSPSTFLLTLLPNTPPGIYFKDSKWRLAVKAAKPPQAKDSDRGGGRGSRGEARLFVGGLPEGVTEADLLRKFRDSDPIDAFVPPRQTATPYYGFITVSARGHRNTLF